MSPFLGAMADAGGRRKPYIFVFQMLLVLGCAALWWAYPGRPDLVGPISAAVVIATIGAEMSIVFNNAQLPHIVRPERMGWLSGFGWGLGYCGGLIALFAVLAVSMPATFGLAANNDRPLFGLDAGTNELERLIGPASALWLVVFVIPMFLFTPDTATRGMPLLRGGARGRLVADRHGEAPAHLQERAALSHRLHALQRRARRHHRLRRRLCRRDLRLEHRDARHLRHHPDGVRHSRRLPGRQARRPLRQQAHRAGRHRSA